ncbi:MAG: NUDIX hydrolase [Desulfobacteraceae bacterium]|nr:NUDIX hydrolase [Desulfobacteraceae bacterium]
MTITCPQCGHSIASRRNPLPTVDIIIETGGGIVLVARKNPPYGWAIPGGFVDYGETLEAAAQREALEETGLTVRLQGQLHTYSDPRRDPRHHSISTVFMAVAEGEPQGGDDAKEARIFTPGQIPPLVFDHDKIIDDYLRFKKHSARPQ